MSRTDRTLLRVNARLLGGIQIGVALTYGVAAAASGVGSPVPPRAEALGFLAVAALTLMVPWRERSPSGGSLLDLPAWRWLTAAMAVWWIGDALALTMGAGDPPRALGASEALYLAFYPLALQALASFHGLGETREQRWRVQIDAVIASIAMATLFVWVWPLGAGDDRGTGWLVRLVHLAYPTGDLMLLTGAVVLRARQVNPSSARLLRQLIFALAIKTTADVLHAGSVMDSVDANGAATGLGLVWYGLVTIAAAHVRSAEPTPLPTTSVRLAWLSYASVLAAGVLLVVLVYRGNLQAARGVSIGALLLSLMVLVRQWLAARELRRLDLSTALGVAEGKLAALVRHSSDILVVIEPEGIVRYVSPAVERVLGLRPEQIEGAQGLSMVHPDDLDETRELLARVAAQPEVDGTMVVRVQHAAGGWRWLEIVVSNRFATESINGLVVNLRDVTERRELEGQLEWQAFHDALTGLANRVLFADRVGHALARRARSGRSLGVLFIDLDHFKVVNDTMGHSAGDALLRDASQRIVQEVRGGDTVARLGGDEFAVLLENAPVIECRRTADRLLTQLTRAFNIDGREVFTGASIGLAMAEPGVTLDELVRDADVAMYVAKSEGRGRVVTFDPSMREAVTLRMHLEADLRRAIEHGELHVQYQPQVDLRTGDVLGAEALVRWTHPVRGLIPPSRFVPIAEQAGMMVALSRFVLRAATREAAAWRAPGASDSSLHVAVNLSGRHLQDPEVVDDVQRALAESGLDPSLLTIEITESVMMHNPQAAIAVLRELKALGIKVAVDDFGTGYSSLSYLQQFPIDVLKIDKRFIDALGTPEGDDALARAILGLGDALGLATVAEGIETPRQLALLQAMGCLLGQGYLLSHPLSARQFAASLKAGDLRRHLEPATAALPLARGPRQVS